MAALAAPETVIGFPQAMQNFAAGSFSRPQNVQRVNGMRGSGYRANIRARRGAGEGLDCKFRTASGYILPTL